MNIHLPDALQEQLNKQMDNGMYANTAEFVRQAIREKLEREAIHKAKLEALRHDIDVAWKQADSGETVPFDPQDTLKRAKERLSK